MSHFALLDEGGVVIATLSTSAHREPTGNAVPWDGVAPVVGWTWVGSGFVDMRPTPAPPPIGIDAFLGRFEFQEQVDLKLAAATDVGIDTLLDNLRIRTSIDLSSAFADQARAYLLSKAPIGVLSADRINEIFGD